MNKLQLPPGISVKRRGNAYAIFRNVYEEIGGVVVRGTSLGDTQLQPYVEEPQEKNKQIVALVAQQMSDALLAHVAKKPAHLRRVPSRQTMFLLEQKSLKTRCFLAPSATRSLPGWCSPGNLHPLKKWKPLAKSSNWKLPFLTIRYGCLAHLTATMTTSPSI